MIDIVISVTESDKVDQGSEFFKINFLTANKAHTRPLEKITELLNFRSLRTTKKNFHKTKIQRVNC